MESGGLRYKIRLDTGRVLGPLDLSRVRKLIVKKHILGTEKAREHPDGEWVDIMMIPELADLLFAHIEGKLDDSTRSPLPSASGYSPILGYDPKAENAPTLVLPSGDDAEPEVRRLGDQSIARNIQRPEEKQSDPEPPIEATVIQESPISGEDDATQVFTPDQDPEQIDSLDGGLFPTVSDKAGEANAGRSRDITREETVFFDIGEKHQKIAAAHKKNRFSKLGNGKVKKGLMILLALLVAQDFLFDKPKTVTQGVAVRAAPVRARLPKKVEGSKPDPAKSKQFFKAGMQLYDQDTIPGYVKASNAFLNAATTDNNNVQALAMLASSYLNLIDASNKDENYFSVISRLIEMSRAKSLDLPETVTADVEFYLVTQRTEAAKQRIVDYTKANRNFEPVMFYHIARVFAARGDLRSASRYINLYPEDKITSARVFHFRGELAEKFGDDEAALREYLKAIKLNPGHAKSYLRIVELYNKRARLKDAEPYLRFLARNPGLLAPKGLARAYYLICLHQQILQKWNRALSYIERAIRLDKTNHDYLFEFYTLKARVGESVRGAKREATMYVLMSQGEKLLANGLQQEALSKFLEARQANINSPQPLMKIGDMFLRLNEIGNARMNYQLASEKAPKSVAIWTKYINVLIQSYEWTEAQKAMDSFRKLPVSQSAVDKAAGDLYAKQGRHAEAQKSYRQAMARDTIDPTVYVAYANSLMAVGRFGDAPFFFALALRFDPLNTEATIGTARCIAQSESIERGIGMLNDELQKSGAPRAELLSAVADLETQKGDWDAAQRFVDLSKQANPEYAMPWKVQAKIYLAREGSDKKALEHALEAYKSYSDRNASDPSGYLERYRIFARQSQFENAAEELNRIYALFPKYPNLHYYKGTLYAVMRNFGTAIEEFKLELKNNPGSPDTLIALGKALLEMNDPRGALDQFQRAMILAPRSAEPKHQAAYANYLLKNYAGAVALYKAALALDRGSSLLYKRLGQVYLVIGDRADAKQAFRKYLEMEPDAPDKAEFLPFL